MSAPPTKADDEKTIKRNPHPDFKSVEASRPPFSDVPFRMTQTANPSWIPGSGALNEDWKQHGTVSIDPYEQGRSPVDNYKLLISGMVPRPIGFVSTIAADGTKNLAPFSYTNLVNHDPPIFVIGFSGGKGNPKDTARNLLETGECTINMISEFFAEAANFTSINAPPSVSEWELSGLTQAPSKLVKPPRVAESVFSIEAKLVANHEWTSPIPGPDGKARTTGVTCLVQGVQFHVREDALSEGRNMVDINVLRPVARLGGITYGRVLEGFELPRGDWAKEQRRREEVREKEGKGEEGQ
ncbi:hypothetical protein BJ508DRAFT_216746 [Ascobolus immersus RN42]|uniref:Flavin reductase like domain-containing protein n=1 Tax=Ascobolus immersus RN42 TaxID=1160509 RepID=A0A3N4HJM4_ASCIM|nr:hypothetical protein BJ508DRAFT_216746 [Ascobolus immersus RN42]